MSYLQNKEMFVRGVLVLVAGMALFGDWVFGGRVEDLEIYLLPHSHVNIGYTKLQGKLIWKKRVEESQRSMVLAGARTAVICSVLK